MVCKKVSQKLHALARVSKFLKEKAKSYHEGKAKRHESIYNVAIQLLSFGMDVP